MATVKFDIPKEDARLIALSAEYKRSFGEEVPRGVFKTMFDNPQPMIAKIEQALQSKTPIKNW